METTVTSTAPSVKPGSTVWVLCGYSSDNVRAVTAQTVSPTNDHIQVQVLGQAAPYLLDQTVFKSRARALAVVRSLPKVGTRVWVTESAKAPCLRPAVAASVTIEPHAAPSRVLVGVRGPSGIEMLVLGSTVHAKRRQAQQVLRDQISELQTKILGLRAQLTPRATKRTTIPPRAYSWTDGDGENPSSGPMPPSGAANVEPLYPLDVISEIDAAALDAAREALVEAHVWLDGAPPQAAKFLEETKSILRERLEFRAGTPPLEVSKDHRPAALFGSVPIVSAPSTPLTVTKMNLSPKSRRLLSAKGPIRIPGRTGR